jgi:hypothetical protein
MHDLVPPETLILKQDPLSPLPVERALERPADVCDERGALGARQRHVHATDRQDPPLPGDVIMLPGLPVEHGGVGGGELDHVHGQRWRAEKVETRCFYRGPLQQVKFKSIQISIQTKFEFHYK